MASALCPHLGLLGVRMGMLFLPTAVGLFIGNPIAGAILKTNWVGLQVFCGATVGLSTASMFVARFIKVGAGVRAKC